MLYIAMLFERLNLLPVDGWSVTLFPLDRGRISASYPLVRYICLIKSRHIKLSLVLANRRCLSVHLSYLASLPVSSFDDSYKLRVRNRRRHSLLLLFNSAPTLTGF